MRKLVKVLPLLLLLSILPLTAHAQCDNYDHCTTYSDLAVVYPPFSSPYCGNGWGGGCTECYNCDPGGWYGPGDCITEDDYCDPFEVDIGFFWF